MKGVRQPASGGIFFRGHIWLAAVATSLLGVVMVQAALNLPREPQGLAAEVLERLDQSGVEYPVTAVLLNFRAYDTWLELVVLLLGMLGVLVIRRETDLSTARMIPASEMLLRWLVRLLIPLMVLVGGYLLWLGKFAPGGAFQAGVLLAAAGVLLWLAGFKSIAGVPETMLRLLLLVGFGGFLIAAVGTVLAGRLMLDFPEEIAGLVILLVETAATVSIAATLTALLIGLQPACSERPAQKPAP